MKTYQVINSATGHSAGEFRTKADAQAMADSKNYGEHHTQSFYNVVEVECTTIEVTFPKLHHTFNPMGDIEHYELETFDYPCDPGKRDLNNLYDAYYEALRRGHNPNKNIRFRWK